MQWAGEALNDVHTEVFEVGHSFFWGSWPSLWSYWWPEQRKAQLSYSFHLLHLALNCSWSDQPSLCCQPVCWQSWRCGGRTDVSMDGEHQWTQETGHFCRVCQGDRTVAVLAWWSVALSHGKNGWALWVMWGLQTGPVAFLLFTHFTQCCEVDVTSPWLSRMENSEGSCSLIKLAVLLTAVRKAW